MRYYPEDAEAVNRESPGGLRLVGYRSLAECVRDLEATGQLITVDC